MRSLAARAEYWRYCAGALCSPSHWQSLGDQDKVKLMMSPLASPSLVDLLDSKAMSNEEVRRLVGWQALLLVDLLRRRCITVRYAERILFNLAVVQRLEQRRLKDCVEVVDWGMQLEDWEAHTPNTCLKPCVLLRS